MKQFVLKTIIVSLFTLLVGVVNLVGAVVLEHFNIETGLKIHAALTFVAIWIIFTTFERVILEIIKRETK